MLKQARLSFPAPRMPVKDISRKVQAPNLPLAVNADGFPLLPLNLILPSSISQASTSGIAYKQGLYAVSKDDSFLAIVQNHVEKVLKPLAKLISHRVRLELAQLMARDSQSLSELLLSFFSPASRRLLVTLHGGRWPAAGEVAEMIKVTALVDRRLKGGYVCLAEASEADGGNILKAGSRILYIGKATGNKRGLGLRVKEQHMVSTHTSKNMTICFY